MAVFAALLSVFINGIQFLVGYRVDSLIIEFWLRNGQSIVCSKENIIDTIVKSNEKERKQEMTFNPKYQNTGRIAYKTQMANRPVPDD